MQKLEQNETLIKA